jgi:uncharacterized protein YrrD
VADLGAPISYLTLEEGVPIYASGGQKVGKVAHVLADFGLDVFEGIVVETHVLPPTYRYVDAEHVAQLHERGVVLAIDSETVEELPRPGESPGAVGDEALSDELRDRLKRAWESISGRG